VVSDYEIISITKNRFLHDVASLHVLYFVFRAEEERMPQRYYATLYNYQYV
jgi:hypothetical protein